MATFKTVWGYCEWVEQELGWAVPSETPEIRRKAFISEVAKVKRRMAGETTGLYSWDNLALTVAWLKHKRKPSTPWGVLGHVQVALKAARYRPKTRPADIAEAIAVAVAWEQFEDRADSPFWIRRLTRAAGPGREEVYTEWENARENP